ncbi:MAG: prepilin-type N-terminal cleavage/methylation domain-containing protein [Planctomycetota bacterium]
MTSPACKSDIPAKQAFTLIELLVVISIIALLIGILLPVLGSARDAARRSVTMSDMRQAMLAHTLYQQDYDGHVPWGYAPASIDGIAVTVNLERSGHTFSIPVAERFPWRLERYIDNVWQVLYSQQEVPELPQRGQPDAVAFGPAYNISLYPSLALNTVYVGGHDGAFQGFVGGSDSPNTGSYIVFYDKDVPRPSEQIVFTEVLGRIGDTPFNSNNPEAGLHWSTPPRARGLRWVPDGRTIKSALPGNLQGIPVSRTGAGTPTGFFDGHAEALDPDTLNDMRLWSIAASDADDDPIP